MCQSSPSRRVARRCHESTSDRATTSRGTPKPILSLERLLRLRDDRARTPIILRRCWTLSLAASNCRPVRCLVARNSRKYRSKPPCRLRLSRIGLAHASAHRQGCHSEGDACLPRGGRGRGALEWAGWRALEAVARGEVEPRIRVMRAVSPFNPSRSSRRRPSSRSPPSPPTKSKSASRSRSISATSSPRTRTTRTTRTRTSSTPTSCGCAGTRRRPRSASTRPHRATSRASSTTAGRRPGCRRGRQLLLELIFDGQTREFHLCFFASRRIRAGCEIIVDYGPDYWEATHEALLRTHAKGARRRGAPAAR